MENSIRIPLNLPYTKIVKVSNQKNGDWLIEVESTLTHTHCHKCGRKISKFHGLDKPIRLRHLPLFEVPVYLELRPKRYRCPFCSDQPTSTQKLEWYDPHSPNTKAYENWLLKILINSTVIDTAQKLGVSPDIVTGVLERHIAKEVDWSRFENLSVIGIDEISLKRGHQDFVGVITVPTQSGIQLLAILPDRKQDTVSQFFASIPIHLRRTVERVCSDMHRGFIFAAREHIPQAKVVIDRFHVARLYRNCADDVRKREQRRVKQALSKSDYEVFKGVMWTFRKNPDDLDEQEKEQLERFFEQSPTLALAWQLREELTEIFEGDYSKKGAKCAIRAWCKRVKASQISEFDSFLVTIENWLDEITNYFLEGWSSGFVEGFNNRIKAFKRRCYGIFDVKRMFQRLTLDLDGYEQFHSHSTLDIGGLHGNS